MRKFKIKYISDFEYKVIGDNLNCRKPSTKRREKEILEIVREYDDLVDSLIFAIEPDLNTVISYAIRLGSAGKKKKAVPISFLPAEDTDDDADSDTEGVVIQTSVINCEELSETVKKTSFRSMQTRSQTKNNK